MEPNQNPPSEREWTIEEQEEFFASMDAVTGLLNGGMASNATVPQTPITIDSVLETLKQFPVLKPKILMIHPQRYPLVVGKPKAGIAEGRMFHVGGIKVVQDPMIPLTQTVRKRRWLPKSRRKHVYTPKKYRNVEVDVLGWWLDEQGLWPAKG